MPLDIFGSRKHALRVRRDTKYDDMERALSLSGVVRSFRHHVDRPYTVHPLQYQANRERHPLAYHPGNESHPIQ